VADLVAELGGAEMQQRFSAALALGNMAYTARGGAGCQGSPRTVAGECVAAGAVPALLRLLAEAARLGREDGAEVAAAALANLAMDGAACAAMHAAGGGRWMAGALACLVRGDDERRARSRHCCPAEEAAPSSAADVGACVRALCTALGMLARAPPARASMCAAGAAAPPALVVALRWVRRALERQGAAASGAVAGGAGADAGGGARGSDDEQQGGTRGALWRAADCAAAAISNAARDPAGKSAFAAAGAVQEAVPLLALLATTATTGGGAVTTVTRLCTLRGGRLAPSLQGPMRALCTTLGNLFHVAAGRAAARGTGLVQALLALLALLAPPPRARGEAASAAAAAAAGAGAGAAAAVAAAVAPAAAAAPAAAPCLAELAAAGALCNVLFDPTVRGSVIAGPLAVRAARVLASLLARDGERHAELELFALTALGHLASEPRGALAVVAAGAIPRLQQLSAAAAVAAAAAAAAAPGGSTAGLVSALHSGTEQKCAAAMRQVRELLDAAERGVGAQAGGGGDAPGGEAAPAPAATTAAADGVYAGMVASTTEFGSFPVPKAFATKGAAGALAPLKVKEAAAVRKPAS
jgi:hypothetical protein